MEQPPFQQQAHPNMATWYPHQYQAQQPPPLQQHHRHPVPWPPPPMPPSGDQSLSYSQPPAYHHPQGGYYPLPQQQVHHQYPAPPQSVQPQFTYMYGQQDQAWQAGNANTWGYQQWSYPAQNNDLSQEEVWAAKARAWAASKAVQDEPKPASTTPSYPDYAHQKRHGYAHSVEGQQHHESVGLPFYPNAANQDHNVSLRPGEHAVQRHNFEEPPVVSPSNDAFEPKATIGPSSADRLDQSGSSYVQSGTRLLSQSQASPLSSQPQLSYNEKLALPVNEHPQQPPIPPNYHPLPQHQMQQPCLQPQYQPPVVIEAHEGEFGLSPASLQNWAPVGGPGMPFPSTMGAGASQFDPLHPHPHPHQMPVPLYGRPEAPQGLGFSGTGSFVGGVSPSLGSGPGATLRPVYVTETVHPERPKKAAVPSWLREEIMKKKAAAFTANISGTATGTLLSDESSRGNGGDSTVSLNERHHAFDKLRRSSPGMSDDEEDDQEEEIEAARTDAINQEIKRLLTEVLLKVTGDLFDEIAQEVMDEDDAIQEDEFTNEKSRANHIAVASDGGIASMSGRVLVTSLKVPVAAESDQSKSSESEAPGGDVLGLGNYASDDEENQDSKELNNNEQVLSSIETKVEQQEHMNADSLKQDQVTEHSDQTMPEATFEGSQEVCTVKNEAESDSKKDQVEVSTIRKHTEDQEDTSTSGSCGSAQNGRTHVSAELVVHAEDNSFKDKDRSADRRQFISEQTAKMSPKESTRDEWHEKKLNTKLGSGQHHDGSGASKQSTHVGKLVNQNDELPIKEKQKGEVRNEKMKEKDSYVKERKREDTKDSKESKTERVFSESHRDSSRDKRKEKLKEKDKHREKEYDRDRKRHDKRERDGRPGRSETVDKKIRQRSSSSSGAEDSSSSSSDKSRGRIRTQRSRKEHHRNMSPPAAKSRNKRVSRSRSRSPHAKHLHRRNVPSHEKSRRNASRSPVHRRRHM